MTEIAELFRANGLLASAVPGFHERTEQVAMAERVAHALAGRERLLIEAGTGTGKTFAYLVPALLSGMRVIVSTGTRTLQDQLYHRDLPTVSRALGRPVHVALLKGRSNYLCPHRLELAEQQATERGLSRDVATALPVVRAWSRHTRTADIAELDRLPEQHPVWPWVTSTRENCLGTDCPQYQRCPLVGARREAQVADVIVVNHYLLLADLVMKEEGFAELLPGADAVIVDEAHQLADVASQFLGFTLSGRQIASLARDLTGELLLAPIGAPGLGPLVQSLERQVADAADALPNGAQRIEQGEWPDAFIEMLAQVATSLREIRDALEPLIAESAGLAAVRRRASECIERIEALINSDADQEPVTVRWAQASARSFTASLVPVDISAQLDALFDAQGCAWICTSATLAVGDDFSHFSRRIGLADAAAVRFDSPFDFRRQALLYLPSGLDAPSSRDYTRQVIATALPVLATSGGRAFLLFTSHRALREGAAALEEAIGDQAPYPVLVQGDAPRDVLLSRFRELGNAVLLGTGSFWEGVDVKGPALSVVVIDKLPFAVPDDPVLKARLRAIERRGGNPFFEEQVPQAVIALKQGVGRLIRDGEDAGVVVLCDPRVRTRGYGRLFLDSLPPMPRTDDPDRVAAFLRVVLERRQIVAESTGNRIVERLR